MGTFWEKLKFWTKVTIFGVAALYFFIIVTLNWGLVVEGQLRLMFIEFDHPRVLLVLLVTAVLSVFGWWLFRTIFKTLRQWQRLQDKSRTVKLEREVAEMKAKAGMLQTKGATAREPAGFPVTPVATVASSSGTASASSDLGGGTEL
jgi:hypothetical protein